MANLYIFLSSVADTDLAGYGLFQRIGYPIAAILKTYSAPSALNARPRKLERSNAVFFGPLYESQPLESQSSTIPEPSAPLPDFIPIPYVVGPRPAETGSLRAPRAFRDLSAPVLIRPQRPVLKLPTANDVWYPQGIARKTAHSWQSWTTFMKSGYDINANGSLRRTAPRRRSTLSITAKACPGCNEVARLCDCRVRRPERRFATRHPMPRPTFKDSWSIYQAKHIAHRDSHKEPAQHFAYMKTVARNHWAWWPLGKKADTKLYGTVVRSMFMMSAGYKALVQLGVRGAYQLYEHLREQGLEDEYDDMECPPTPLIDNEGDSFMEEALPQITPS